MRFLPLLLLFFCCAQTRASVRDDGFRLRDHTDLQSSIDSLARAHRDLVTLEHLATSRGERAVTSIRLTGPGDAGDRPGVLLVANLEGPRVFSSAVALDHAWRLAEGYASDESVREFLDTTVVHVVPRANPDAAAARFARPLVERRATGPGVDDDRDGREGEDPPSDVNGDGLVTWIRVEDPEGAWRTDPSDPRVLIEADRAKGERGKWKLYTEGRDLDGDERVSEDAAHDAVIDRNFPAGWEAHEAASGLFPGDEPEVQGIMEFLLGHPEIVMVVTYGGQDNLVETPKGIEDGAPSVKRIPPTGIRKSDAKYLEELGSRYRERTGSEASGEDEGEAAGRFTRWCYEHRGLWVLSAALWELPDEAPEPGPESDVGDEGEPSADSDTAPEEPPEAGAATKGKSKSENEDEREPSAEAKKLAWIDAVDPGRFVPWTSFEHPELGAVEVGGFAPYARHEPPEEDWEELAGSHFDHFVTLGATLPRIELVECTREELGDGVWRVSAVLQNEGFLPFFSRSMRSTRTTRPGRLRLELPDGATLLGGSVQVLVTDVEGSGGRHEQSWLVLAPEGHGARLRVTFDSDHAGRAEGTPEVKP